MRYVRRFGSVVVLFSILVLFLSPFTACTAGPKPDQQTSPALEVTPEQAWAMIQQNKNNPRFVILDVRTPKEFFQGHIAKAINIDFYSLSFNQELEKLDPAKTYLVYCLSGGRSRAAQKVMLKMGFKKVYNMTGGILAWSKKGLPVTK